MSKADDKLETRGRLWLWSGALEECKRLLELAVRAEAEMKSTTAQEKEQRFTNALHEFSCAQPDYTPEMQKLSHLVAFKKIQQREFGAETDCFSITNYFRMLAIVFSCQIFNIGYGVERKAAQNTKAFVNFHLGNILRTVFTTPEDREQFDRLCSQLIAARNEMIGHADARAFSIVHGHPISTMRMSIDAIQDIDFQYLASILEPLNHEIRKYTRDATA